MSTFLSLTTSSTDRIFNSTACCVSLWLDCRCVRALTLLNVRVPFTTNLSFMSCAICWVALTDTWDVWKANRQKIFPLSLWNHPLVCLAACFSAHLLTLHLCFCVISFFLCSACPLFWSRIMYRTYRMWVPSPPPPPSYLHTFLVRLLSNACKSYN